MNRIQEQKLRKVIRKIINESDISANGNRIGMSMDKIKTILSPRIFKHWTTINDADAIKTAEADLTRELDSGVLSGNKYYAELYLLRSLMSEHIIKNEIQQLSESDNQKTATIKKGSVLLNKADKPFNVNKDIEVDILKSLDNDFYIVIYKDKRYKVNGGRYFKK